MIVEPREVVDIKVWFNNRYGVLTCPNKAFKYPIYLAFKKIITEKIYPLIRAFAEFVELAIFNLKFVSQNMFDCIYMHIFLRNFHIVNIIFYIKD